VVGHYAGLVGWVGERGRMHLCCFDIPLDLIGNDYDYLMTDCILLVAEVDGFL